MVRKVPPRHVHFTLKRSGGLWHVLLQDQGELGAAMQLDKAVGRAIEKYAGMLRQQYPNHRYTKEDYKRYMHQEPIRMHMDGWDRGDLILTLEPRGQSLEQKGMDLP